MQLRLPGELGAAYKSFSQRARVITEAWGEANLYCASCSSNRLVRSPAGTPTVDFSCPQCEAPFQLKSSARAFARRIPDAAYEVMRRAILRGETPHLLTLQYDPVRWEVVNLLLIPRFAFSLWAIEKRKPLSLMARRRGWVGCDIALDRIAPDARISMVAERLPVPAHSVRQHYDLLRPLERQRPRSRGWTLDVLTVVRSLGKPEFTLEEMYAHATQLQLLHPGNRHVEAKIRQQLQRLRDLGLLEFVSRGRYRMRC